MPTTEPDPLIQRIQSEVAGEDGDRAAEKRCEHFPRGVDQRSITDSYITYPGTENKFQVYIPTQYTPDKPACLLIKLDGFGQNECAVLDKLIAANEVPTMIGIGISPGAVLANPGGILKPQVVRWNRRS